MTSTKLAVLSLLQKHTLISGTTMAKQLQLSRNAIWKTINTLNDDGFSIISTPHGYTLQSTPLTVNQLVLQSAFPHYDIYTYDSVDSTNTKAKQLADTIHNRVALFVANEQTAGRGRYMRSFYSPKGSGIYMSLLYPSQHLSPFLSLTTPLCAVAILEAVQQIIGVTPDIKWVNDLFFKRKKVCGILTEAISSVEIGAVTHLIIGIGINIQKPSHLSEALIDIVGFLTDQSVDYNAFIVQVIHNIIHLFEQLPNTNFLHTYKKHCFVLGQEITVMNQKNQSVIQAKAIDINNDGGLIIQKKDGTVDTLYYNDISIKL